MVQISDQLTWELVRRNHSFLNKKNGHTRRSGAISFSTEKGNVKSLNMFYCSGLANSQPLDVVVSNDTKAKHGMNKAVLIKKSNKASVCPKKGRVEVAVNKPFHRSVKTITSQGVDNFYRRDLKAAVLGKYTKVYQANRRAKGVTKLVPCKKGRGNLSTEAKRAAAGSD